MKVQRLTKQALAMTLYVVLSLSISELGYGPIQFRVSEVLTLLAFVDSAYVLPLTLGCAIVNLWSPFGIIDVVFGTCASFFALYCMTKTKNIYIAGIFPAIFSIIIGLEIAFLTKDYTSFWLLTGQIMLSEWVIVWLIGIPIFRLLQKNKHVISLLQITTLPVNAFSKE